MACTRRCLASSFTHLSRRFRRSFSHVILEDLEGGQFPRLPPSPQVASPPPSPAFSRSMPTFGPSLWDGRRLGLPLLMGLDPFPRRYSSISEGGWNEAEYIKDFAEVLTDASGVSTTLSPVPGEVAAAATESFFPFTVLQCLIDGVHSFTGLNWWASIALTAVLIRVATIPLLLNKTRVAAKYELIKPEADELKRILVYAMDVDPEFFVVCQKRMTALFQSQGLTPYSRLKGLFIQPPIFISFYMSISNMVEKVPSFKEGGTFWFTDLTTPDPIYMLPVLTSLTFLATVKLNGKNFPRVLALMAIPFTANFPKAIFCYWITSNIFSLAYGFVIQRPPVRRFLNIPVVSQPSKKNVKARRKTLKR